MKKKTLPRAGSGALGKGGRFAESLPDLALGKVPSHLTVSGLISLTLSPPQPRNPLLLAPARHARPRALPPPQPGQPAPSRHVRPRAPAAAAGPPQPRHARPPASRPRTPTTQSFIPPPQAEERGGVARRPLPQAVLHPPPEGHRVSTLPHSSFFPKRLRRSGALFFRRGLREPPAAGV